MKKRSLAILAGGMSLALLLSSCGPSSAPTESPSSAPADETGQQTAEEPVTITYCNFNASGGNEETLQKMYEAFHEEHPNITVEIETIAMDDYFTQMQTRVAGGTAPDCYELNIENFASYANKGVLAEISGVDLSRLDETALSAFNVDGKQYGLQFYRPPEVRYCIVMNKTLLKANMMCRRRLRPSAPWAMIFTATTSPLLTTSSTRFAPSSAAAC